METKYYTIIEKDALREDFLYIPKKFKRYLKEKEIFWIYKIINLKDDRVYIGKTNNIRQRALNYINEYLKGDISRKLTQGFQELGIGKFLMFPIEIAYSEQSAEAKEKYYIDLNDSINDGFNVYNNSAPTKKKRIRPAVPHTLYSKMIRSKLISAINTETREVIFSTGLKLFGDYINRSKDEVKSAAKRETRLEGFFIYYLNASDFRSQIEDAISKIKRNSVYEDYKLQYHDFIKYSKILKDILKSSSLNGFDFTLKFITQSNDPCGYEFKNINDFFDFYNNASNKII